MKRQREPEAMASADEAREYEDLASRHIGWILKAFATQVARACPDWTRCLDLGTGTGHLPALLAEMSGAARHARTIVGADLSEQMLRMAARRQAPANVRLEWLQGDICSLPVPDHAFDLVVSHLVLHHLDDPVRFFDEVNRVASPDGVIFVRDVVRPGSRLEAWLAERVFTPGYTPVQRRMYGDSIRSAFTPSEVSRALRESKLSGCHVARCFVTHLDVVRSPLPHRHVQRIDRGSALARFVFDLMRRPVAA